MDREACREETGGGSLWRKGSEPASEPHMKSGCFRARRIERRRVLADGRQSLAAGPKHRRISMA